MPSAASPSAPALRPADFRALAAFRYHLGRFLQFSAAAARRAGLAPQQHQALLAIKGFPGREQVTVGELAERLQLKHHSAVGLVDRLTDRGLVRRQRSAADRRRVLVALTARGERLLASLSASHRDELRRVGPEWRALLARLDGR
jgi:DNA-binding MarR family transcriptional regulator